MSSRDETRAWFSRSVEGEMGMLYGVALRLTRSGADAEDLVADAVLSAWKSIDSLAERNRFRPWLLRIMHNRFISDYRKRNARPEEVSLGGWSEGESPDEISLFLMEQADEFLDWWANPEKEVLDRMLGEHIRAAMDALPEVFRVAVLLVNVEGLSYDEAAEVLGVPAGTIRSRMKRGRTLLQKALWEIAVENGLRTEVKTGEGS